MNEQIAKVLRGFIKLSETEKREFIEEFNRYRNASTWDKPTIEKYVEERASIGPKNTICTCCGR